MPQGRGEVPLCAAAFPVNPFLRQEMTHSQLRIIASFCVLTACIGTDDGIEVVELSDTEFRDCLECPVMVSLPPSRFLMGSPPAEGFDEAPANVHNVIEHEKPQIEVEIAYPLAMGKYEVTFREFDACVADGGCSHSPGDQGWGRGRRPVVDVNRSDAEEYTRWLAARTGRPYRLPSEAEGVRRPRSNHHRAALGSGDRGGQRCVRRVREPVGQALDGAGGLLCTQRLRDS